MSVHAGQRRDIFISHGSGDKAVAEELCRGFEAAGLTCWIAPRNIDPGSSWTGSIMQAISDCRVMVLIFSAASNASDHVEREILHAVEKRCHILPIRIDEVLPTGGLAYCLVGLQWYDAVSQPLSRHIASLVTRLTELLARPHGPDGGPAESGSGPQESAAARSDDIYFHCEKCGQSMVTDASAAGRSGECPTCQSPFTVPIPGVETAKPVETAGAPARSLEVIPEVDVKKIESCFTAAMGPIGPKIVRKAIAAGTTRSALRTELLENIPVEKDRASFLRCCGNLLAAGPAEAVRAQTQSRPKASPSDATGPALLDPAGIVELKTTLATFLGPLARVMVDRALPTATSVSDLIDQLAADLDTAEDRERFARLAAERLKKHFRLR
jgi:hypothetical protein